MSSHGKQAGGCVVVVEATWHVSLCTFVPVKGEYLYFCTRYLGSRFGEAGMRDSGDGAHDDIPLARTPPLPQTGCYFLE